MRLVVAIGAAGLCLLACSAADGQKHQQPGATRSPESIRQRIADRLKQQGLPWQGRVFQGGGAFWFGGPRTGIWFWGPQTRMRMPGIWFWGTPPLLGQFPPAGRLGEIGLTEAQRKELAEVLASAVRERVMVMTDPQLKPAEKLERLRDIRTRVREQLEKLLTPEQKEKLRSWQVRPVPPGGPGPKEKRKGKPA